jgi:hypothetical protein
MRERESRREVIKSQSPMDDETALSACERGEDRDGAMGVCVAIECQ